MHVDEWFESFLACLVCSLLALPQVALAGRPDENASDSKTISREQRDLNNEAVRAIFDEDYVRAIALLEESLDNGKLNITYLNLGRAYHKAGKCREARAAYQHALSAPEARKPAPKIVRSRTEQYLAELKKSCAKNDSKTAASSKPSAKPDTPDQTAGNVRQMNDGGEAADTAEADSTTNVWGWSAAIAGVALVGGGVGMHFLAESKRSDLRDSQTNKNGVVTDITQRDFRDREQTANTYDTIGLSAAIVGGLAAATGVYLLVTSEDNEHAASTSLWLGDDAAGMAWTTHF